MCRTREEIIESSTYLQKLELTIEICKEKIKHGKNGDTQLSLDHAISSLNSSVKQEQDQEDNVKRQDDLLSEIKSVGTSLTEHIKDKELHSPKGILVRNSVIVWMVGLVILISGIVQYAPELLKYITGLF